MDNWEIIMTVILGVGLSAACGFRVFIPPLIISIAHQAKMVDLLGTDFAWMGSSVALAVFAVAAVLEICAYYIPWLDNALDSIAAPAAVVAGTVMSAAVFGDMNPVLKWTLAAIAGGGAAGAVQLTTTVTRGASSMFTGGTANWLVSTAEGVGAVLVTVLAIVASVLVFIGFLIFMGFVVYKNPIKMYRKWDERNAPEGPLKEPPVLSSS